MAELIECPTCKKQVSSNAEACPNCGELLVQRGKLGWITITCLVLIVLLIGGMVLSRVLGFL